MVEAMETLQGQGQGHVWVEVDMGCLNEGIQIREKSERRRSHKSMMMMMAALVSITASIISASCERL